MHIPGTGVARNVAHQASRAAVGTGRAVRNNTPRVNYVGTGGFRRPWKGSAFSRPFQCGDGHAFQAGPFAVFLPF